MNNDSYCSNKTFDFTAGYERKSTNWKCKDGSNRTALQKCACALTFYLRRGPCLATEDVVLVLVIFFLFPLLGGLNFRNLYLEVIYLILLGFENPIRRSVCPCSSDRKQRNPCHLVAPADVQLLQGGLVHLHHLQAVRGHLAATGEGYFPGKQFTFQNTFPTK